MNNEAGERIKWRPHFNQLIARPIPKTEFPKIVERMIDDGLVCILSTGGYQWYSGRYRVSAAAVKEIWNLSQAQWSRFMGWVYIHDPFSIIPEEGNEDGEDLQTESS
tara:strand:- start:4308 stop:4628 length:321 start_codon:yes stop_codon:yes gene_type:complete